MAAMKKASNIVSESLWNKWSSHAVLDTLDDGITIVGSCLAASTEAVTQQFLIWNKLNRTKCTEINFQ